MLDLTVLISYPRRLGGGKKFIFKRRAVQGLGECQGVELVHPGQVGKNLCSLGSSDLSKLSVFLWGFRGILIGACYLVDLIF